MIQTIYRVHSHHWCFPTKLTPISGCWQPSAYFKLRQLDSHLRNLVSKVAPTFGTPFAEIIPSQFNEIVCTNVCLQFLTVQINLY